MIKFVVGVFIVIGGVSAVEAHVPLSVGILIATFGVLILVWGMAEW